VNLSVRLKALSFFAVLLGGTALVSCSEDVQTPCLVTSTCPQDQPPLQDVTLDAITYDTSIAGYPETGFEPTLFLAHAGDTLDARIITRFDTLPTHYTGAGQDSVITRVDSAWLQAIRRVGDSTTKLVVDAATIEAFDVTAAGDDTTATALSAQFIPANKIGSLALAAGDNPDTIKILVDTAHVRAKIQDSTHKMRVGIRMVSAGSAQLRIPSQDLGEGFSLMIRPSRDTSVATVVASPTSDAPAGFTNMQAALADFNYVASARPIPANTLRVGGVAPRRVMFRFNVPARIVDSSAIIRATLFLTQRPAATAQAGDTVHLRAVPVLSSSLVTDPHVILGFAAVATAFQTDSLPLVPKDSGFRKVDVVRIVRSWRGEDTLKTPRAIALLLDNEAASAPGVDFFSMEAAAGLRPQLRISFASKPSSGRP
jgi:hypothetical protein